MKKIPDEILTRLVKPTEWITINSSNLGRKMVTGPFSGGFLDSSSVSEKVQSKVGKTALTVKIILCKLGFQQSDVINSILISGEKIYSGGKNN